MLPVRRRRVVGLAVVLGGVPDLGAGHVQPEALLGLTIENPELQLRSRQPRVQPVQPECGLAGRLRARVGERQQGTQLPHAAVAGEALGHHPHLVAAHSQPEEPVQRRQRVETPQPTTQVARRTRRAGHTQPLDLDDLALAEQPAPAVHPRTAGPRVLGLAQVQRRCTQVRSAGQCGHPVQPTCGSIGHHSALRHHQGKCARSKPHRIGSLRGGVHPASDPAEVTRRAQGRQVRPAYAGPDCHRTGERGVQGHRECIRQEGGARVEPARDHGRTVPTSRTATDGRRSSCGWSPLGERCGQRAAACRTSRSASLQRAELAARRSSRVQN